MTGFKDEEFSELIEMLREHDYNVYKHSEKVANLSVRIGKELKLSNLELQELYIGGFLHDIGKLHVEKGILNKKTKLTDNEKCIIQNHVNEGVYIVQKYTTNADILAIIGMHHVNEDGSGYSCIGTRRNAQQLVAIVHICDLICKELESIKYIRDTDINNMILTLKSSNRVNNKLVNLINKNRQLLTV